MALWYRDKEYAIVWFGQKAVSTIWINGYKIYEYIKSCFGKGFWINTKEWKNTDAWKN
jgi:hypothetical protein